MTDIDLLLFGCAITFIAAAGAYVYVRERFVYSNPKEERRRPEQDTLALAKARRAEQG